MLSLRSYVDLNCLSRLLPFQGRLVLEHQHPRCRDRASEKAKHMANHPFWIQLRVAMAVLDLDLGLLDYLKTTQDL